VVYRHNGKPLLILMLGNDQMNESKLATALGGGEFSPMPAEDLLALTGADGGSIGPAGLKGFKIIADQRLEMPTVSSAARIRTIIIFRTSI